MKRILPLLSFLVLFPGIAAAETIDQTIDRTLAPITDFVSKIVFYEINIDGAGLPLLVIWLIAAALFFTFYMGFVNFRQFRHAIQVVRGKYDSPKDPGEVTHFQALSAALSGTVGIGNIAGVAIAISLGGPGATFWMIMAGLFGMTTKFVECTLGVAYRDIDENGIVSGGPMYYLSKGLAKRGLPGFGKFLAVFSALMVIGGSVGSGALFQVNQATEQFLNIAVPLTGGGNSLFGGAGWIFGILFAIAAALIIFGGIKKIAHVASILVPFMAALYLGTALVIIIANIDALPGALGAIISGAFSPEGVGGGIIGVLVQGMRRATFSNEAGIGSAPIAHAAVKTNEPVSEGMVALLEPFIDTVVICTMTALVIIITGSYIGVDGIDGISLTSRAFASVFAWFPYLLAVAVILFAFSTAITWYYYGERAVVFLSKNSRRAMNAYKGAFLSAVVIGSAMNLANVVGFADAMVLGMAIPNLAGLYIMAPEVKGMLKSYLERVKAGEIKAVN